MMFDAFTKDHVLKGFIKKQKRDFPAIDAMVSRAMREIEIAKATAVIDEGTAFTVAYSAMLHAGRALMLAKGFRPIDGAQHKTVVAFAGAYLGTEMKHIILQFERMRKKRNILMYEVSISISGTEVTSAVNSAMRLTCAIRDSIIAENPQQQFSFE
jgi:uncharacterized protein (UPF0332 family)